MRFPGGSPHSGWERRTRRKARRRVGARIIANESRVRETRMLGSMSGGRDRGQGGDRGTGTGARVAGELLLPPSSTTAPLLDSTGLPEIDPPPHSSVSQLPLSAAEIINTVAGGSRSAERPPHPKGLVARGLFAERPSRPSVRVRRSVDRPRRCYTESATSPAQIRARGLAWHTVATVPHVPSGRVRPTPPT